MPDNLYRDAVDESALPAALLDGFDPVEPEASVWSNILAEINHGQPGDNGVMALDRRNPRWVPWLLSTVAAVTLLVGAVALIANQQPEMVASTKLIDPVSSEPVLTIETAAGGASTVAASGLPVLSDGETYQLWAVTNGEIVSVGLLGVDPGGAQFRIEGEPSLLAVTIEIAGGVAVSAQDPVGVWRA